MAFKELFSKYKVYTIISIIALLLLVAGGVTAGLLIGKQGNEQLNVPALAADFTDTNGLEYTILSSTDLTVSVSGYSGTDTIVVIPETVSNGGTTYTVTTIEGGYESTGAFANKTTLTSITILSSITTMQTYAFYNCTALTEINFNATNMNDLSTYNYVFYKAGQDGEGITVNIGANVTKIPAHLFDPYNSSYAPKIVTVNFAEGSLCESIGSSAFEDCSSLTEITIPESVTSIGGYAFWHCSSLTSVKIGNSVTSIGDGAFYDCSSLTSITIPDSVTSIGDSAFRDCSSLTEVTIPNSVTSIGDSAFSGCNDITSVYYLGDITGWVSIDFGNYEANPLHYADNLYLNGVLFTGGDIVLDTVTSIGASAFYGQAITSITIGNQVTSIGEYAFSGCGDLSTIVLGNGLTEIGYYAFSSTPWLTNIRNNHNGQAQSSDGTKTYMIIAPNTSITSYDLTGVNVIAGGAFSDCSSLTSITIPDSVTSIGESAFIFCTALTEINFNTTNMNDLSFGNDVFFRAGQDGAGITVNIGANVTKIPAYLFYSTNTSSYVPKIVAVNFAEGSLCESIGEYAFCYCISLTSITIPDSVTSVGERAFRDCSSLTSATIGNSVTSIGESVFYGCSSLTEITIPDSVTNIGDYAFYDCTALTSVTIGNSVTSIGEYAFYYCSSLTEITIPDSVTNIGESAFYYCSSLISATIGNSVTNIGEYAFRDCSSLTSITIPESVTSIGVYAFSGCTALTSVTIGNSVTSIGNGVFRGCTALTSVTIGNSVTSIGEYAFRDCTALTEINFNATNMNDLSLGNDVFYDTGQDGTGITVNIGANVTKIPAYLFRPYSYSASSSPKIVTVNFAEGSLCETIGEVAFYGCSSLTSIVIPNSVTSIGESAFSNCTALTEINFNATNMNDLSSNNMVFYRAGQDSTGITVNIGANVTRIPAYLFNPRSSSSYAPKMVTVNFAEGSLCESIGERAFSYCSSLTSITIPNSVMSIGESAFSSCRSLTSITIPDSVTSIGEGAFRSCSSLNNVYFYNDIQNNTSDDYIGRYAFFGNASTVTYWVKDSTSLNNIRIIDNDDSTKFTNSNFQVIASLTITTDASLGQILINGELTDNYYETLMNGDITLNNVIAVPKANCAFLYWLVTTESGSTQVTDNPLSMTITETTAITAVFSNSLMDGVGVTALGGGQVRMGGYEGEIDDTTQVTLNAICYSGYTFDGWYLIENGVETKLEEFGNSDAITINVSAYEGKLIIAKFVPTENTNVSEDLNN